jgi:hypothetical protein
VCAQDLICLKSKYLLFFSAWWVFRHAGMDVSNGTLFIIFFVTLLPPRSEATVKKEVRFKFCKSIIMTVIPSQVLQIDNNDSVEGAVN